MKRKEEKKTSFKRVLLLFVVYSLLFLTIFSFLDYYDYYAINPVFLTIVSLVLGGGATFSHIKSGNRSRVDDIVDKL